MPPYVVCRFSIPGSALSLSASPHTMLPLAVLVLPAIEPGQLANMSYLVAVLVDHAPLVGETTWHRRTRH